MTCRLCTRAALVCAALACSAPAVAQAPSPEPSPALSPVPSPAPTIWTVTAGAGLALTSGNTDTSTVNASYEVIYTPQSRHVVRSDGLMIRGKNDGELSADRLGLNVRHEFGLNERAYVFSQNRFLRDRFKSIDYLLAPAVGLGYSVVETPETTMAIDLGFGGVWEKNAGVDVAASGSLTLGETLAQALTATTSLTQSFSGLWKTTDFGDSLHVFNFGVSATISTRTQLKVELIDTYKSKPPLVTVQKNDVAVLVAVVYKL
jgi:putative salt-induced outer membrane protein YdiY